MKHNSTLLLSLALLGAAPATAQVTFEDFSKSSLLASGHWVKVEIGETGVYEINYTQLKDMGFNDPSKVAVFGRGGLQMSEKFTLADGTIEDSPELVPVAIKHINNEKIIFYGRGCSDIRYVDDASLDTHGRFVRVSKNIYAQAPCYFITDSQEPALILDDTSFSEAEGTKVTSGVDYVYFEEDRFINPTVSGRQFWSHTLTPDNNKVSFPVTFPDLKEKYYGIAQAELYTESAIDRYMTLSFAANPEKEVSFKAPGLQSAFYVAIPNAYGSLALNSVNDEFNISFDIDAASSKGWLDYFIITYPKSIPTLKMENYGRLVVNSVTAGTRFMFPMPDGYDKAVWDVSNPNAPKKLVTDATYGYCNAQKNNPSLLFFDEGAKLNKISAYQEVENSNLRAEAAQGAEYLIITTPRFEPYARSLAEAHEADGTKTMVAVSDNIFNEFSAGVPDFMAYKWLAKMLYLHSETQLKQVLLFGPVSGDFRGSTDSPLVQKNFIIGYQSENTNRNTGATNGNDFIGVMSDYYSCKTYELPMEIGVGVLPVHNETEAQIAVDKTLQHLAATDFAHYLNQFSVLTCPGDTHMSDNAGIEAATRLNAYTSGQMLPTPIVADTYPSMDAAKNKWMNSMLDGSLLTIYFGHADPTGLATTMNLYRPTDILKLKNTRLPLALFMGCSLSNFDRDKSGIGEKFVINTPKGLIGAFLSTREAYANENRNIANILFSGFTHQTYTDALKERHSEPRQIGTLYALGKSRMYLANEYIYQYMGDPALVLPFPNMEIDATKEGNTISGSIINFDDTSADGFNGEAVIKILAPAETLLAKSYYSKESTPLYITYEDNVVHELSVPVVDGSFTATVPAALTGSEDYTMSIAAYDPATRNAAATRTACPLPAPGDAAADEDTTAPVFESVEYDPAANALVVQVRDDQALSLSSMPFSDGIKAAVDGASLAHASSSLTSLADGSRSATYLISLSPLAKGTHTAQLSVSDLSGNRASTVFEFFIGTRSDIQLTFNEASSPVSGTVLDIAGELGSKAQMVITDKTGREVMRESVTSTPYVLDHSKLPAKGLYRAYVSAPGGYSDAVNVPVLAVTQQ